MTRSGNRSRKAAGPGSKQPARTSAPSVVVDGTRPRAERPAPPPALCANEKVACDYWCSWSNYALRIAQTVWNYNQRGRRPEQARNSPPSTDAAAGAPASDPPRTCNRHESAGPQAGAPPRRRRFRRHRLPLGLSIYPCRRTGVALVSDIVWTGLSGRSLPAVNRHLFARSPKSKREATPSSGIGVGMRG